MRPPRICRTAPVLLLLLAAPAAPGPRPVLAAAAPSSLAVSVSLEPPEIRIGDAARLTVTVEHPAGGGVELPELDRGREIVVTDRKRETAALAGGRERTTLVVHLTSFAVGEHGVGSGEVTFTAGGGTASPGTPLPHTLLRVKSVLAGEETPMRGAKDLVRWPAPLGRWAGIAAGFLLLAAAVYLGARRVRAGRRRRPVASPPAESPGERALRALAALSASQPIPQQQVEPWYRELSSIVRRYLEERFGLKAPERTTEEFIREAAGSGVLAPAHQALVRAFLEQCDLVKFARHLPPREDMASAVAAAERLVRET